MADNLTLPDRSSVALRRDAAMDAARKYAHESRSASTWRTYESAWRVFTAWCDSVALAALPAEPDTVAMFIGAQAELGLAESTLAHRLAAIRLMHLGQGLASPHNTLAVMEVMRGLRRHRARAGREPEKEAPIVDAVIKRLVDHLDVQTRRGVRERALLLYGFGGALRRSELVGIDVGHIDAHERGHLLTIPFSEGDQAGKGQTIPILAQVGSVYCPVAALQAWIAIARIDAGPVFRRFHRGDVVGDTRLGDRAVAEMIKDRIYALKDPELNYPLLRPQLASRVPDQRREAAGRPPEAHRPVPTHPRGHRAGLHRQPGPVREPYGREPLA